jgi:hypothetical protein
MWYSLYGVLSLDNLYTYLPYLSFLSFLPNNLEICPLFILPTLPIKRSNSTLARLNKFPSISVHELPKNKLFVFQPDKKTLAYVFEDCGQAARKLTPQRCAHLSDSDLKLNKNLQHIRRVINKGVLTTTEIGKFFIFQNPDYSSSLALVP